MLDPVELKLFPSCFDCITWSRDGDLAVALGEYVHVLIPQLKKSASSLSTSNTQWATTKFRANVFTNKEWPMIFPQPSETFSLGEEQSTSHVVALAWSPQHLAKYSRHVLAVLTSNLVLSLWELVDGHSKWVRTVVVNEVLRRTFGTLLAGKSSILLRKQRVRSFCWSPEGGYDHNGNAIEVHPACRDMSLLAVANDADEIILIRVRNDRRASDTHTRRSLWVEVISYCELPPPTVAYTHVQPDSLFGQSMRSVRVVSHIAWGRWRQDMDDRDNLKHISHLAIIHATELRVFLLHTLSKEKEGCKNTETKLDICFSGASPSSDEEQFQHTNFQGPLCWIDIEGPENIPSSWLAVGYLGGYVVIPFDSLFPRAENKRQHEPSTVSLHHALRRDAVEDCSSLEWEPITAITSTTDAHSKTPVLHIANFSSSLYSLPLPAMQNQSITASSNRHSDNAQSADLHRQIEGFRSRFDLDHDLGGMSISKIWGMASYRGWVAACFTVHPSDMVEYVTTARECSRIVFTPPHVEESPGQGDGEPSSVELPWNIPLQITPEYMKAARAKALSFILDESHRRVSNDPWVRKLQYAAICCVITDQDPVDQPRLLEAARSAAQWLSSAFNLVLSQELSCIDQKLHSQIQHSSESTASPTTKLILAKNRGPQTGEGHDVFEFCDICGSGIDWYSAEESQCADGHVFARCGLTFLSIQDPSISKRCSGCGGEVLDAELVEAPFLIEPEMEATGESQPLRQHGGLLDILCDTFDTCIYCGGRFRE
ncbi:hypothetical protein AJ78_03265 [Emergomyces pasteurianus Ep9510]|uniref:Transcription factor IIIC putative zinc-finger domain-containing protein n=1 Tax=Emergomyces pasteurianus Ep9510 TaxID=1447872 RepID=A0A1J9PKH3_9EURO|nr:hypothetical protein AJ78_03265 [Emergomyces pasteurianus Ep9510]